MTGRERILAAFSHVEPDRVPCFEQSIASDVASAILGRRAYCGTTLLHYEEAVAWMQGDEAHAAFEEQLYQDVAAITEALELDMIHVPWRRNVRPTRQLDEYNFLYGDPDGDHEVWGFDPLAKTFYRRLVHRERPPSGNPDDLEPGIAQMEQRLETATEPVIPETDWTLRQLRDFGDKWMICAGGGLAIPYEETWLLACALRPDLVARYLDVCVELACLSAQAWARHGIKLIWGGGDMADNHGPLYSPKVFRDLMLPRVQRYVDRLHELGMWYVYRTDGNLWPIADDFFLHSRIDGFGECDHDAGMRIPELKARYPHITYWGDVPCGSLLHRGTAEQVREFVRRRLETCRGNGGWILGSSNSIVPGTPPENVLAMFETAREG